LDKAGATPVTRVVNLLKEMTQTLKKEMDEDEELYEKLECWCNTGKYEKEEAIEAGTAKVDQLTAADEGGVAKSKELAERIKGLTEQIAMTKMNWPRHRSNVMQMCRNSRAMKLIASKLCKT
jgi:leucyl aminopeptidase (aminopeptidase T)